MTKADHGLSLEMLRTLRHLANGRRLGFHAGSLKALAVRGLAEPYKQEFGCGCKRQDWRITEKGAAVLNPASSGVERAAHLYESFEPGKAGRICDEEGISIEDGARGAQLAEERKNARALDRQFFGATEFGGRR